MRKESGRGIDHWDLWNLRALFPEAGVADLENLRRCRGRYESYAARLGRHMADEQDRWLGPGRDFLASNPDFAAGLFVSMHIGPYQLLAEPLLHAGLDPVVLLNREARPRFEARAAALRRNLAHRGRLDWIEVGTPGFVRKLIQALRDERPVVTYLDGNTGDGGTQRTRDRGLLYPLPGRDIRVRRGLGRLIHRLGCPVNTAVVRWSEEGEVLWQQGVVYDWSRIAVPDDVTRLLYDWGFAEVLATPEQWSYWNMLTASYDCFASVKVARPGPPPAVTGDLAGALDEFLSQRPDEVCVDLVRDVAIWPGDVLADLTEDRFHTAEGLRACDLTLLRRGSPTLAELVAAHGRRWTRFHVLRLWLLELVTLHGVSAE